MNFIHLFTHFFWCVGNRDLYLLLDYLQCWRLMPETELGSCIQGRNLNPSTISPVPVSTFCFVFSVVQIEPRDSHWPHVVKACPNHTFMVFFFNLISPFPLLLYCLKLCSWLHNLVTAFQRLPLGLRLHTLVVVLVRVTLLVVVGSHILSCGIHWGYRLSCASRYLAEVQKILCPFWL